MTGGSSQYDRGGAQFEGLAFDMTRVVSHRALSGALQ